MAGITVTPQLDLVVTSLSAANELSIAGIRLSLLDALRLAETLKAYATGLSAKAPAAFTGEEVEQVTLFLEARRIDVRGERLPGDSFKRSLIRIRVSELLSLLHGNRGELTEAELLQVESAPVVRWAAFKAVQAYKSKAQVKLRTTINKRRQIGIACLTGTPAAVVARKWGCGTALVYGCMKEVLRDMPGFERNMLHSAMCEPGLGQIGAARSVYANLQQMHVQKSRHTG